MEKSISLFSMSTETFSTERVRQAVRAYTERPKHSLHKLAKESGVDWSCLKRFVFEGKGLNIDTLEKLWPHIMAETSNQPPKAA